MAEVRIARDSRSREARALRMGSAEGILNRIHVGSYLPLVDWAALDAARRHRLEIRAVIRRLKGGVVVSHGSAAVLHGLPEINGVPARVHVTDPDRPTGHSWKAVVVHGGAAPTQTLASSDVVELDGLRVTSLARTLIDQALTLPFADTVVQLDAMLRRRELHLHDLAAGRDPALRGAWVDKERLVSELDSRPRARARTSARLAIEFANGLSDSGGESLCRVVLFEIGAPVPVQQREFRDSRGLIGISDFWFDEQGAVLEFDGLAKYRDPRLRSGQSPEDVVVQEKVREDRIRACPEVRAFIRCTSNDIRHPERLRALLSAGGVPVRR